MPSNIEFKARVDDMESLENLVRELSDTPCEILIQEDVFFQVPKGRLKLRIFPENKADLIFYERPDVGEVKQSNYSIYKTRDPQSLLELLDTTLGATITVKKVRHLYMKGQIRIHLDRVEGLGTFAELEYVLNPGEDAKLGHEAVEKLMKKMGIGPEELIAIAYADLLGGKRQEE